ncbi:UDP-N-acetylglucosamine--undecaprenyl-phosphate N-acetylglucosaminephosphotransferase [Vibrio hannami]|uniref:UDP-N-acetylglucosamine--undecaprenyl-phosphate N-acetylglucosaminephosphotransferase n=1 Tax=Vibrio hannami TaxID=2717094 RepID=UPI00240F18F0|nr:UDP-N-acetylglucosamine--undecaprenyl-phosphate N-acetylglucosaminephosphotransferase [Vibrio hannami]MDG3088638.1 UDP-N-acetylglucosamine--undecaprenyl-phosphate N-acetylglucosaminephosphotransferase [Vibrio hannami]
MLTITALTFILSTMFVLGLRKAAVKHGYVDRPTARKVHTGDIPLVGGISLFFTILAVLATHPEFLPRSGNYLFCSAVLVTVGALDDKIELGAKFRLLILTLLSVWLTFSHKANLVHLGDLFGFGDIFIPNGKELFTILAVIAAITAFNMSDGLDGLLGGLSAVTFGSLGYFFFHAGQTNLGAFCILFVVAMLPYILCNLDIVPHRTLKVFMGDSGSYFIGFTIIWLLVESTQFAAPMTKEVSLRPVTALWITAVPVMDMVMVMLRRIGKRQSPLKADKLHLHHIFQRLGFSSSKTLITIVSFSILCAAFGIYGELTAVHEYVMLYLFVALFFVYFVAMRHIWKIVTTLRSWKKKRELHQKKLMR